MIKFGTGGFRGVIGDDFNHETVCLITEALARLAKEDKSETPVVVGYDNRFMSDFFAGWVAEVLAGHGITVLLYTHAMPSPGVMRATRDLGLDYGIMITASHNPYNFNGMKIFLRGGCDADVEFTARLEAKTAAAERDGKVRTLSLDEAKQCGKVKDYSNVDEYVAHIEAFIRPEVRENSLRILYDNLCGVGAVGLKRIAADLRIARFDVLHENHDAFFSFGLPNPTEEMILPLGEKVCAGGYDYAMATDSDGDRLGILDEKGNYVSSNDILASLYYYLVRYRGEKGDAVKNCATSVLLDMLAEKFGYRCHEVDVGFKNISAKMRETDALIGGESSGGLTCRGYLYGKDSAFSGALFMEMCAMMRKPVSEIICEVHEFAGYSYCAAETAIPLKNEAEIRRRLPHACPDFGRKTVQKEVFGANIKYKFSNAAWALVRFSGTEPMIRVFAEAETREETRRLCDVLANTVRRGEMAHAV